MPKLPVLAATPCGSAACPTVYLADDDHVVVQGYSTDASVPGIDLPAGESLVRIPRSLLVATVAELGDRG